jgi:leucyl/phenylalanyl-tRNA--protein transferase
MPPREPPPTRWRFPTPDAADDDGLLAVGADLEPGTLIAAYRQGSFPMPVHGRLAWWSPDPRGILPLQGFHASRSLRRARRRFEVRLDSAFEQVVRACADPARPHRWIDEQIVVAYCELHRLGFAHSIEAWVDDELAGGLYGVRIGGLFAGESMFHHRTDASKVAVWATVDWLRETGASLFDVQWTSPHLYSLGAVDVPRARYLELLRLALT